MLEHMEHDFRYISKSDPKIKQAYQNLLDILHQVQDLVREKFTFKFTPVGSYSRNMITYDANSNIGFDFDFIKMAIKISYSVTCNPLKSRRFRALCFFGNTII